MSAVIDASDEVLSGEAVAIDVQPIGFILRALGALIDMVIGFAIFIIWQIVQLYLLRIGFLDQATDGILRIVAMVVSFVVVPVALEVSLKGRSLGKLAVGGRIVRIDGGAIGFRHAFIRALLGVLEIYFTLGGIAIIAGAFSARSQRLGDMVAGTYSQRVRVPKLVPHTPLMPVELAEWSSIADVARLPDRLARRVSQFLQTSERMSPVARGQVAQSLLNEVVPFVSPIPAAAPERVLTAVTVLRRERELRALQIADQRAEKLTGRKLSV